MPTHLVFGGKLLGGFQDREPRRTYEQIRVGWRQHHNRLWKKHRRGLKGRSYSNLGPRRMRDGFCKVDDDGGSEVGVWSDGW